MPHLITLEQAERLDVGEVHELYRKYVNKSQVKLMTSFGFGRELVDRAEGAHLHTRDGRTVLDFTGGVGVLNHGHNHPRIVAARKRFQDQSRMEVHKTYFSPYLAALGHNIAQVLPADLSMSFFPNSGAEAVEGAVKLAYKYHRGKRGRVLRADIAFHGKLLGSGGLTGGAPDQFAFPTIPGIGTFRYGDLDSVRDAIAAARRPGGGCDVYALLIEPFSASTMNHCSAEFLHGLRELCTAEDIILIFDEIYTGWGKTGSMFYFMRHPGLVPDVVTTSKSFGGGKSSISAFVAREPVFRKAYDSMRDALLQSTSTTYYGFGEEAVTALEAVEIAVTDDFPARARHLGDLLGPGLERIRKAHPDEVADVRGSRRAARRVPLRRAEAARPDRQAGARFPGEGPVAADQAHHVRGDRRALPRPRHLHLLHAQRPEPARGEPAARDRRRRRRALPRRPRRRAGPRHVPFADPFRPGEGEPASW